VTRIAISHVGLLLCGRFAGLLLVLAGVLAGLILYSEFKVWTDPVYVRVALVILCSSAVALALIQGSRMLLAKTTAELSFQPGIRLFAVAIVMASLLLGFLLNLPAAVARGPIPTVTLVLQATVVLAGFAALFRRVDHRPRDGA